MYCLFNKSSTCYKEGVHGLLRMKKTTVVQVKDRTFSGTNYISAIEIKRWGIS